MYMSVSIIHWILFHLWQINDSYRDRLGHIDVSLIMIITDKWLDLNHRKQYERIRQRNRRRSSRHKYGNKSDQKLVRRKKKSLGQWNEIRSKSINSILKVKTFSFNLYKYCRIDLALLKKRESLQIQCTINELHNSSMDDDSCHFFS